MHDPSSLCGPSHRKVLLFEGFVRKLLLLAGNELVLTDDGKGGRGDVNEARRIRRCIALHVEFLTILLALDLALNYSASCRKGLRLSAKLASSCIFCRQRPLALNSITTKGGHRLQQNNFGQKLAGLAKPAEELNYFA